jgi:hypothetical protein
MRFMKLRYQLLKLHKPECTQMKYGCVGLVEGDRSGKVVKVLCYKSEGRWFDSRGCHRIFSLI